MVETQISGSSTATTDPGLMGRGWAFTKDIPGSGSRSISFSCPSDTKSIARPPGSKIGPRSTFLSIDSPRIALKVRYRQGRRSSRSTAVRNRRVSTLTPERPDFRTTALRNADRRSEASTRTSSRPGFRTRRGIAGNPFPDPRSSSVPGPVTRIAAAIGSRKCRRTIDSSLLRPVRLIFLPQCRRSL